MLSFASAIADRGRIGSTRAARPSPTGRWMPGALLAATLAGCTPAPVAERAADPLVGRWIGVEGMMLDVAAGDAPGRYMLTMQWDLDHRGSFAGVARGDTIAFTRDGVEEVLRPTDGDATGLKYLAGKRRCLTVKSGEGYCRA